MNLIYVPSPSLDPLLFKTITSRHAIEQRINNKNMLEYARRKGIRPIVVRADDVFFDRQKEMILHSSPNTTAQALSQPSKKNGSGPLVGMLILVPGAPMHLVGGTLFPGVGITNNMACTFRRLVTGRLETKLPSSGDYLDYEYLFMLPDHFGLPFETLHWSGTGGFGKR